MGIDLAGFRAQFPALERLVWLNTPTLPPAARPVLAALRAADSEWESGEASWQAWERQAYATRGLFAGLLGVPENTVALVSSLAEGATTVAASLPPGRVVVGEREFHSNLFPWLVLEGRGADVVTVPAVDGVVPTEALVSAVDDRTVLVAVSEVQSSNGYRVDLEALAERCRETGTRLFVNLTQAAGALRTDMESVRPDFLAAHGYKWLLGPRGAAWLHVRPDRLDELRPLIHNWHTPADPYADYYGGPLELPEGARRLDTSFSWLPWVGARAALELLASLDAGEVERRCLDLAAAFRDGARSRGFRLVPEERRSHIVAVSVPDPDALLVRLRERGVTAAVRGGFLRLGFHGFNDAGDVDAALGALGRS